MQQIITRSSHNEKGRKVYARSTGGRAVRVSWDYALSAEDNHHAAAEKLVNKLQQGSVRFLFSQTKGGGFLSIREHDWPA